MMICLIILQLNKILKKTTIQKNLYTIFLIRRNSVTAKNESKPDDALSSMPKGLSIKNDPFIQQFDLAITLYEMKDYEKAKILLDEIIDKAKNQKLIQQAVDLRSKI